MIDERSSQSILDNNRYPDMRWTTVRDLLSAYHAASGEISK
jgi:hypothetical protein